MNALKVLPPPEAAPAATRDLPIDFMRGVVLVMMTCVHIELFSLYSFLVWERVGVFSSAEGFVILSGVVLGMVSRTRIARHGLAAASAKVVDRGIQLYRVNIILVASFIALAATGLIDVHEVTNFTNRVSGQVWPTYPGEGTPPDKTLARLVMLRMGPHQTQVLGLYICVMFLSPIALWLLHKKRATLLMGGSFMLYSYYQLSPGRPTSAQFEYAFPLLAWQFLFFAAMAIGFNRGELREWLDVGRRRTLALSLAALISLGGMLFTWNGSNPHLPGWAQLDWIEPAQFGQLYERYCKKSSLGLLRLVNNAALLTLLWWGLHRIWPAINRTLGWFFVPIGQASLYVFLIHVYVVMVVSNVLSFGFAAEGFWTNTVAHSAAIATLYLMVRYKVLFRWIPR